MPFPWKKPKGSRISQFVADHINSSKHGGSLVVQTGFPTSLVDLFHKNRDRLKKPSKKKRSAGPDPVIPPPVAPSSPSNQISLVNYTDPDSELVSSEEYSTKLANPEECSTKLANSEECSTKSLNPEKCSMNRTGDSLVSGKDSVDKVIEDGNKVFVVVLKILVMVVLALVTKRLVLGVSMSAFSLFFLEYVGKYLNGLLKPVSKSQKMLKMLVQRVLCIFRDKRDKLDGEGIDSDCFGSGKGQNLNVVSAEMQIVQDESNLDPPVEEIIDVDCSKILEFEEVNSKEGVLEIEEDCKSEVLEIKQKGSRRAKMRSKMSKLVPKKLCKSRKKGSGSKSEVPDLMKEDKHEDRAYERDVKQFECSEELCDSGMENISVTSSDPCELLQSEPEANVVVAKAGRQTDGILGYWVLCLIVLSGLVGGRILAIVLTLSWCWMMRIQRRCIKLPMLRSSAEISG